MFPEKGEFLISGRSVIVQKGFRRTIAGIIARSIFLLFSRKRADMIFPIVNRNLIKSL